MLNHTIWNITDIWSPEVAQRESFYAVLRSSALAGLSLPDVIRRRRFGKENG